MNLKRNRGDMDKTITIRTLIGFVSAIGVPILIFLYTLNQKADMNELRSKMNATNINEIKIVQKESIKETSTNFGKVLSKLHEMDLKIEKKLSYR